jgi:hypothetical protein
VRLHQAKRRDGAAARWLVIVLSVAASGAGCSLVDGWGGLEGGSSGGSGGSGSSGGHDGSATGSDGGDAGPVVVGAACGNTRCDGSQGKGCCVVRQAGPGGSGGGGVCEQATACSGQGNAFLACDDSSECGSGASCCFEYTGGTSTCTTAVCQGLVMCSGTGGHCPSGSCVQAPGLLPSGYSLCM